MSLGGRCFSVLLCPGEEGRDVERGECTGEVLGYGFRHLNLIPTFPLRAWESVSALLFLHLLKGITIKMPICSRRSHEEEIIKHSVNTA